MGEIEEINLCYYLPAAATACLAHTHSLPKKTLKVTLVATSVPHSMRVAQAQTAGTLANNLNCKDKYN